MILKKSSNWRNKEIETRYWYEMNALKYGELLL